MKLEDLIAVVGRSRRPEAPAAGSGEYERIYASSLDRALGAPSPKRDWRRVPWPVTAGLVAAVLAIALFVPLPRVHLGSTTTTTSGPSSASSCAAGAGPSIAFMLTSTGDGPAEKVTAMELPAGKVLWSDSIPALLLGAFNPPGSEDVPVLGPLAVALAPGAQVLYVTAGPVAPKSTAAGALLALSVSSGLLERVVRVLSLSPSATGLAISPDGDIAYVGEAGAAGGRPWVDPVNLVSGTSGAPIQLASAAVAISFSPDGRTAYVTTGTGMTPIDVVTGKPQATIPFQAGAMAVSPSGDTALVGNLESNVLALTMSVVDLAQRRLEAPVRLLVPRGEDMGAEARSVEFTCDGSDAYVAMSFGLERVELASRTATLVERPGTASVLFVVLAAGRGAGGALWIATPSRSECSSLACGEGGPTQLEYVSPSSDLTSPPVATVPGIVSQMVVAPAG
jgi:hypothetical protein